MCGIAAVFDCNDNDNEELLRNILSKLEHRGEKETSYELGGSSKDKYILGTHRLAITNKKNNKQPSSSLNGNTKLVTNGQLFNFYDLSKNLDCELDYKDMGDSHVLASLIEKNGLESSLNSMIWEGVVISINNTSKMVTVARDHMGIKPLYYCYIGDKLCFSSEIKGLSNIDDVKVITPVEPGELIQFELGSPKVLSRKKWWKYNVNAVQKRPCEDRLQAVLEEAIKNRIPSEHFGILLSGGLDSSLVFRIALMYTRNFTAYTLATPTSPDLDFARRLCKEHNIKLVEVEASSMGELNKQLPETIEIVESWEWQVINHSAPMYKLFERIQSDNVRVLLTGEGADELFFGYESPGTFSPEDKEKLRAERITRLMDLHKTNCRRLDRMSMHFTLECRVPFLDRSVVDESSLYSVEQCLDDEINKRPLRMIGKKCLPQGFYNREKISFAKGAGYQYGKNKDENSVFGNIKSVNSTSVKLIKSARYSSEIHFMGIFEGLDYNKADYLSEGSI